MRDPECLHVLAHSSASILRLKIDVNRSRTCVGNPRSRLNIGRRVYVRFYVEQIIDSYIELYAHVSYGTFIFIGTYIQVSVRFTYIRGDVLATQDPIRNPTWDPL